MRVTDCQLLLRSIGVAGASTIGSVHISESTCFPDRLETLCQRNRGVCRQAADFRLESLKNETLPASSSFPPNFLETLSGKHSRGFRSCEALSLPCSGNLENEVDVYAVGLPPPLSLSQPPESPR